MKPAAAVFTIVFNESLFLPIWLKYYSWHFDMKDILVLDHESDDGSTEGLDCNVQRVVDEKGRRFDHRWLARTVIAKQKELLARYETVLFTEVDEIVFPRQGSLAAYVASFQKPSIRCTGYELQHSPEKGEVPYDPGSLILDQRRYWWRRGIYDKPLLTSVPLKYYLGFHSARENSNPGIDGTKPPGERDEHLVLLHIHRMDKDLCFERHRWRWTLNMENTYEKNAGESYLEKWWCEHTALQPIPSWVPHIV